MPNILDYLEWRGDLSLELLPFGPVDALVLDRLSYIPFDGIVPESLLEAPVPLRTAAKACLAASADPRDGRAFRMDKDAELLSRLIGSARFADCALIAYTNVFSEQEEEQFSATTILLPNDEIYVSFRGTDGTIIGWKEDFSLAFADVVPAQKDAAAYLARVADRFSGKLRIGGHSKGGNLAVYAATFSDPAIQPRILCVTNHDGPGFNEKVVADSRFTSILDRVHTYLPQSSVIGMLLTHEEDFSIVHSTNTGLLQHDLYSWEIARDRFIPASTLTNSSQFIDRTLKDWVRGMSEEQRAKMIDGVFSVLGASDGVRFRDILQGKNTVAVVKAVRDMDDETRGILKQTFSILAASAKKTLPEMLEQWAQGSPKVLAALERMAEGRADGNGK